MRRLPGRSGSGTRVRCVSRPYLPPSLPSAAAPPPPTAAAAAMGAMAEGGAAIAHQQQQQPIAIDTSSAVVAAAKNSFPSQNGFSHHSFSQNFVLDAEEEEEEGGGGGGEGGSDAAVAAGGDYGYGQQQQQQQEKCPPVVVGLQPVALVDHVAKVDWSLLDAVPGERGGSMRVTAEELDHILAEVNTHMLPVVSSSSSAVRTLAGGSVANTIRGLAGGLGIRTSLVGVRGDDERGQMFAANMKMAGVDLSRLREVRGGRTAQCACLVDAEGNRTMRPCFLNAVGLKAEELSKKDFRGAQWLVLNGYGFYGTELLETAVQHAKQEGVKISMDLASFEVVRNFRPRLMRLLESGNVDLVFANEDEARELIKGEEEEEENKDSTSSSPESSLRFLAKYCERAVVMLGAKGCIARHGKEMVRVSAIRETVTVDTTGAGDLFASGFLYGILNNLSLEDCCKMGCCTGGAVVCSLGGEIAEEGWQWMHQQLIAKQLPPIRFPVRVS